VRNSAIGILVVCFAASLLSGCGSGGHRVQGKVHFADGSSLDTGRVTAESSDHKTSFNGYIKNGVFHMEGNVPSGTYQVAILSTVTEPMTAEEAHPKPAPEVIHKRFSKSETSNLSFKVPDQLNWDITVEKP